MTVDAKLRAEKAKSYKVEHDVERLHHLIAAANIMRDHPATNALAAALVRELSAMNMKQMDLDAAEKEADAREAAHMVEVEDESKKNSSEPARAPSVPRR